MSSNESLTTHTEHIANELKKFFDEILNLQKRKNQDYGMETDGLWNFRETSRRLNQTMARTFMNLMEKHWIALEKVARGECCLNEGAEDRLRDMALYSGLFYLALKEETNE